MNAMRDQARDHKSAGAAVRRPRRRPARWAGVAAWLLAPALAWAQPMTWNYEYDAVGNLTKITDPRGQVTEHLYDALSRRTQIRQPAAQAGGARPQIGMAYDGQDQLKSVTDPRNLVTGYTTSGLGDTTTQTSPDTGNTIQTFNAAGLLVTRRDARGVTATWTYDALNVPAPVVRALSSPIGAAYPLSTLFRNAQPLLCSMPAPASPR
jgi:YD repeat-containing protein